MAKPSTETDLIGANGEQAALHNRRVVLRAVQRGAPISRTEIARQSGLTKQTIARIADKLIADGLIIEARRRHGLRGQPAIELELDPSGSFAIGANIDRDHLTVVAVDATGNVRGRIHHEERYMLPDRFMELMRSALAEFRRKRLIDETRLVGVGLAIPDWLGEVELVGFPAAYHAWTDFDVRAALKKLTHHPIHVENDANAAAAGELQYGLGAESRTFFYILANAGLGGGLVMNGVRHRGLSGAGGEIGWLPTGQSSDADRMRPLGRIFSLFILYDYLGRHGVEVREPRDLLTLDARGKALVSQWLREVSRPLAEAVLHIGMIIDPDAVVIGGRFPVRLIDELLRYVNELLAASGRPYPSIHRAASSEDAGALGAAAMPLADMLAPDDADSPRGRTSAQISDHNSRTILEALRRSGPLTRNDLAQLVGLTIPGITNITRRLLADGLLLEARRKSPGAQIPSVHYSLNPDGAFAIGARRRGDHVEAILVDLAGQIRARERRPDLAAAVAALTATIPAGSNIVGTGIACDEQVAPEPGVLAGQATVLASLAETTLGRGAPESGLAIVLIEDRIRTGLFFHGTPFAGVQGRAGRIGEMRTGNDRSLLDDVASAAAYRRVGDDRRAIARWTKRAALHLFDAVFALAGFFAPGHFFIAGDLPEAVTAAIVAEMRRLNAGRISEANALVLPEISSGTFGEDSVLLGASLLPFFDRLLPNPLGNEPSSEA